MTLCLGCGDSGEAGALSEKRPWHGLRRQGWLPGRGGAHNGLALCSPEKQTDEPKRTHDYLEECSREDGQLSSIWASTSSCILTYGFSVVNSHLQSGEHSPSWVRTLSEMSLLIVGERVMTSRRGGPSPQYLANSHGFQLKPFFPQLSSLPFQIRQASLLRTSEQPGRLQMLLNFWNYLIMHLISTRVVIPR